MPSFLHTRGQWAAQETSPDEGTMFFEGPAFQKFVQDLDRKLNLLVEGWTAQTSESDPLR